MVYNFMTGRIKRKAEFHDSIIQLSKQLSSPAMQIEQKIGATDNGAQGRDQLAFMRHIVRIAHDAVEIGVDKTDIAFQCQRVDHRDADHRAGGKAQIMHHQTDGGRAARFVAMHRAKYDQNGPGFGPPEFKLFHGG